MGQDAGEGPSKPLLMRMPRLLAFALLLSVAALPSAAPVSAAPDPVNPYRERDRSVVALNILPPGQGRYATTDEFLAIQGGQAPPAHNLDQRDMYDSLVQGLPGLTEGNLTDYFKDASFGVRPGDVDVRYSPRPGTVIIRDKGFGVPHIYGTTRADTLFGAGYASGEDRLFMMDVLRHTGRGRLSEFLGPSEANLRMDCNQYKVADYTDAELTAMAEQTPPGTDPALADQARQDLKDYIAGINAYIDQVRADPSRLPAEYPALQVMPREWTIADTVAVASLIGGNLGVGGGGELGNADFLNALEDEGYTGQEARTILDDLRLADDPEAPRTTDVRFPWNDNLGTVNPSTAAVPDGPVEDDDDVVADTCGPLGSGPFPFPFAADGPFGKIPLMFPRGASNALLVGRSLSKDGNPMAVFGPQVGYWSPEILMELDMHGPGLQARGVGFPGISLYVLLGRGDGYGYSATSADGDQVDIRVVELCVPGGGMPTINSTHYLRADGQCVPIESRTDQWLAKPSGGGQGPPQLVTMTTERVQLAGLPGSDGLRGGTRGIVQARGTVGGKPVLFVRQRVTYGGEVDSALAYVEIMDPNRIHGAQDFQRAFARFNFTFNWFYVDDRDIAYELGGSYPVRAPGTDLDLPVWDRSDTRWQRLLDFVEIPKDISPAKGWITSWNNKQAPGFRSSDSNWGYAPVDRVQRINDRIEAAIQNDGKVDLTELVKAMGDAATVDVRGDKVLPYMLQVIGDPGSDRLRQAVGLLDAWNKAGAHRRDLDRDGAYEQQSGVALMDAWWERALEAVFGPVLGGAYDNVPYTHDDHPGLDGNGSAFNDGWYGHLQKDLRTVLGLPVEGPFSRQYCGAGGGQEACRTALLDSLDQAVADLEGRFGGDPASWEADEVADQIQYTSVGLLGVPAMQWQDRPTFQQVLMFSSGCPGGQKKSGVTQFPGSDGRDHIRGTKGPDLICGLGGRDRLIGMGGDDIILGGRDRDRVKGSGGKDRLFGEAGKDRLAGGKGKDRIKGGPGKDRCTGGPGKDRFGSCAKIRHR